MANALTLLVQKADALTLCVQTQGAVAAASGRRCLGVLRPDARCPGVLRPNSVDAIFFFPDGCKSARRMRPDEQRVRDVSQ